MFETKYRIVTDDDYGYTTQIRMWWCLIWINVCIWKRIELKLLGSGMYNTWLTTEEAEQFIKETVSKKGFRKKIVKIFKRRK